MSQLSETTSTPSATPLANVVVEIEAHAQSAGWDRAARVYALVPTDELLAREPALGAQLGIDVTTAAGTLTPIEDELGADASLEQALPRIAWPREVVGCAVVVERLVLPPDAEEALPESGSAVRDFAAAHPRRAEVRIAAGVLRDGRQHCVLRVRSHDGALVQGPDLVPGLIGLLQDTLDD